MLDPMVQDGSDFRERHLRGPSVDFLGAFAVLERDGRVLLAGNRRRIAGADVLTWDLPGGQVEPGELLSEALRRELREELAIDIAGRQEFLFFQEGEKVVRGLRQYAWRSFFYRVADWRGEVRACGEIEGLRWLSGADLRAALTAPYHDSFRAWLDGGGRVFHSAWRE